MMKEMTEEEKVPAKPEEVAVLMPKEEGSPQNPRVATLIPKQDSSKKKKQTTVYSHGEMTQRLSTAEIDDTSVGGEPTIFSKMKDVKQQLDEMMSQRGCYYSNLIALILPLLTIIFGSVFLGKCPIQPNIPIYLIVAGVFSALEILFRIIRNAVQKSKVLEAFLEGQNKKPMIPRIVNFVFLIIWFLIGSAWVYGIYYPKHTECDLTLYKFSFWLITLTYICGALSLVCGVGLIIYANKFVLK